MRKNGGAVFLRSGGALLALAIMAVACGENPPPPTKAPEALPPKASTPPPPADIHERIVPHVCGTRAKLAQLLGQSGPAPAPAMHLGESAPPPPTSVGTDTKLGANQAYRVVAPGTVLIRTEHGMGTGVVIDPKGYVLTNFHVVADGTKQDFVIKVNVTLGELTPTGRMIRQEKTYDAVVVKADPVRDMAVIRLKDAPAKLTSVKLAKSAPQIAEKVISIGHAGIGFLWAAKSCAIASIGERQQDASILAGLDCSRSDPSHTPDQVAKEKKSCEAQKKQMSDAFLSKTQGLALQTDCAITHGDSGGPLVNAAGEIVGLNQSISTDLATAAFHVHLDEIRDFTAKYGDEGVAILPDPLCDGGFNPTLEDIDLDGKPDTLVMRGGAGPLGAQGRMSVLIDLDQDHFTRKKDPLEAYDSEIAFLIMQDTAFIFYDTTGDSRFDLVLVDKDNDGKPEAAYRIDAAGHAKEDKAALPQHDLDASLVKDRSLHARLGKIASAIGGAGYVSPEALAAANRTITVPDPLTAVGTSGRGVDTDGNGKSDMVFARGMFSRGLLIDADESSLASVKPGESADELLKAKTIDAEIAVVVQGGTMWAIYDTDNDNKFDLALMTTKAADESNLFATNAWRIGAGGAVTPAPEQMGRKLLRPGLVSHPRAATAFKDSDYDIASDEGLGALPDPRSAKASFHFRDLKGFAKGTVLESESRAAHAVLIDLDADHKLAPNADPKKVLADGKFNAAVAIVNRAGSEWIYYDTDGDKQFDLVLYLAKAGQNPTQAFRITKNAKGAPALDVDAKAVAGRPIRTKGMFTDKAKTARWTKLAALLFRSASIEE